MPRAKGRTEKERQALVRNSKENAPRLPTDELADLLERLEVSGTEYEEAARKIQKAFENFQLEEDAYLSWGNKLANCETLLAQAEKMKTLACSMPLEERQMGAMITKSDLPSLEPGQHVPMEPVIDAIITALKRRECELEVEARGRPDKSLQLTRLKRDLQAIYRQHAGPDCEAGEERLRDRDNWIHDAITWAGLKCADPLDHPSKFRENLLPLQEPRA